MLFGGTGFVGTNFTHIYKSSFRILSFGSKYDVRDKSIVSEIINKYNPDYVINLASISTLRECDENENLCYEISFNGNKNIINSLKSCPKIKSYLYVSSSEVYDHNFYSNDYEINELDRLSKYNSYNLGKIDSEEYCNAVKNNSYKINIARPFTHIGPLQSARFGFSAIAKKIVKSNTNIIDAGNTQRGRDITDVRDVCSAYLGILKSDFDKQIFNICSSNYINLDSYISIINDLLDKNIIFNNKKSLIRKDERNYKKGSYKKIQKAINWNPKYTIKKTINDILIYWGNN